jgi:hypothetical protein
MCYESVVDGRATERPLSDLLRGERRAALGNGVAAAAIVVAVSLARGASPATTVGAALAAVVLGALLHQAVLVVAVAVQRTWHRGVAAVDSTPPTGSDA